MDLTGDTIIAITSIYSRGPEDTMVFYVIGTESKSDSCVLHLCIKENARALDLEDLMFN